MNYIANKKVKFIRHGFGVRQKTIYKLAIKLLRCKDGGNNCQLFNKKRLDLDEGE
jgi:hypothetical protein